MGFPFKNTKYLVITGLQMCAHFKEFFDCGKRFFFRIYISIDLLSSAIFSLTELYHAEHADIVENFPGFFERDFVSGVF